MAKFFRKRDEQPADDLNPPPYLPTQPVDYTSLPVVEEQGPLTRLKSAPPIIRIGIPAVVLLLVGGLIIWAYLQQAGGNTPNTPVVKPPVVAIDEARAVSDKSIRIDFTVTNATPGLSATAQLLQDGTPIEWADLGSSTTEVVSGTTTSLELKRSAAWQQTLDKDMKYEVLVNVAGAQVVTKTLDVPATIAADFFRGGVALQTPTPAPTTAPTPSGPPTLTTGTGATLLVSPTLGSAVLTTLPANSKIEPKFRSDDSKFFLIVQDATVGWLPADKATIDPAAAAQVPSIKPPAGSADAGPLKATVFNGGNIRYVAVRGTVLGQMIAGQTVTIKEKLANGTWYHVVAPAAEGWVARDLLTIDQQTIASTPIAR